LSAYSQDHEMSHKQGVHCNAVLLVAADSDPVCSTNGCGLPYQQVMK